MSLDHTIPLDGKLVLNPEPHPYRVAKPAPKPAPAPRKAAVEAQAERLRALNAQGHIAVVGKTGTTVFKARYGQ
jgi:hypothetical protein